MSYPLDIQKVNHSTMLVGVLLFSFFVRLPTMFYPHTENDEIIYQTLANKVIKNPLDYSLRGTYILSQLPPGWYDYPIYKHPPLFVAVLAIVFVFLGKYMVLFVPALFGVFTIAIVYLIASRLYSKTHGLFAALILACCPLWLFLSIRIWMETMVTFLTALSFYVVLLACDKKQFRWFFLSGSIFGLALLTKQVALLILPAIIYCIARQNIPFRNRLYFFLTFIGVAVLINIPWMVYYYKIMGTIFYTNQYQYTDKMIQPFPAIQEVFNKPWYYYFTTLSSIYPIYILSFIGIFLTIKRREDLSLVIWSTTVLLFYTVLGGNFLNFRLSFILRYISLALPALAIMASYVCCDTLSRPRLKNVKCIVLMLFLAYGMELGLLNYHDSGTIDTIDPFMVLQYLSHTRHGG